MNDDGLSNTWLTDAKKTIREIARQFQFNQRPVEPEASAEAVTNDIFEGESIDDEFTATQPSVSRMHFEEYGILSDMRKFENKEKFNLHSETKCK